MRVGLLDVDGHNFPSLPLMKLSGWHKKQGHSVEIYDSLSFNNPYDRVYCAKVFTFTRDYEYPIYSKEVIYGGTGYNLKTELPAEAEAAYPDYGLYKIKNTAYGFLTRGCPRACKFCIASAKEGYESRKVADLDSFWRGQKEIKLLGPNLLACPQKKELLGQLIESKAYVDFTQGLDIRLMDEELAGLVMRCKLKMVHFAWDSEKGSALVVKKLKEFKAQTNIPMRKAGVYVLTNFDTGYEFDLERIYQLRSMGYSPYVMVYNKETAPQQARRLQRWVNNKFIFRSCPRIEDYKG